MSGKQTASSCCFFFSVGAAVLLLVQSLFLRSLAIMFIELFAHVLTQVVWPKGTKRNVLVFNMWLEINIKQFIQSEQDFQNAHHFYEVIQFAVRSTGNRHLQNQGFHRKLQTANFSLQLRYKFAVSRCRDFKFKQGLHCLVPSCCFSSNSKCINFIAQKRGIIHKFEFKNPTSTSQTDKESCFVPLNVRLYNFQRQKTLPKSLKAGCPSCHLNVNCKLQTRPQGRGHVTFSGFPFAVFHEKKT